MSWDFVTSNNVCFRDSSLRKTQLSKGVTDRLTKSFCSVCMRKLSWLFLSVDFHIKSVMSPKICCEFYYGLSWSIDNIRHWAEKCIFLLLLMRYSALRTTEHPHQVAVVSNEQMHILFFIADYNEGTWSITNKPNKKSPQENTEPVVNIKQGPHLSVCYSKKVVTIKPALNLQSDGRPHFCLQRGLHKFWLFTEPD